MSKILSQANNTPQKNSTECERYEKVHVIVSITSDFLIEYIFSFSNLNKEI